MHATTLQGCVCRKLHQRRRRRGAHVVAAHNMQAPKHHLVHAGLRTQEQVSSAALVWSTGAQTGILRTLLEYTRSWHSSRIRLVAWS